MKYILIFLISIITFTSCITERKCSKKYPPQIVNTVDTIYKEVPIVIRDTFNIKGDTVRDTNTVYIDRYTGLANSELLTAETEYAKATCQVINGRQILDLIQKDTAIARLLRKNIIIKEVIKVETVTVKVWDVHWYDRIARVVSLFFLSALLILLIIKIIKIYLNPTKLL
jgi:hypothetical protein